MPFANRRTPVSTDSRVLRGLGGEERYHYGDTTASTVAQVTVPVSTPRSGYYISIESSSKPIMTTAALSTLSADYFPESKFDSEGLEVIPVGPESHQAATSLPDVHFVDAELRRYLGKIYSLEQGGQHRSASKLVFLYVERKFAVADMAAVNKFLATVDMSRLSAWSISGLVRSTARARRHLPAWPHCLVIGRRLLDGKVNSVDALFAGL
jgi:hypothetical protein